MRLALALVLLAACGNKERVGIIQGPPLTVAIPEAGPPEPTIPVTATFIDLSSRGAPVSFRECDDIVVAVAKGKASALGEDLAVGDTLLAQGTGTFEVKGEGLALIAAIKSPDCNARSAARKVIRGKDTPPLTWAGGKMTAHLDAEKEVSPNAYVGRLEGSAGVAEHTHAGTWEILCAIDAAGTFTLDGQQKRLGPRGVVVVPPDTKHSWTPDEGSKLNAIQLYYPPGPEQRFKALAGAGKP
jgi:quercetin dioxygenase-like cupin family protein